MNSQQSVANSHSRLFVRHDLLGQIKNGLFGADEAERVYPNGINLLELVVDGHGAVEGLRVGSAASNTHKLHLFVGAIHAEHGPTDHILPSVSEIRPGPFRLDEH